MLESRRIERRGRHGQRSNAEGAKDAKPEIERKGRKGRKVKIAHEPPSIAWRAAVAVGDGRRNATRRGSLCGLCVRLFFFVSFMFVAKEVATWNNADPSCMQPHL